MDDVGRCLNCCHLISRTFDIWRKFFAEKSVTRRPLLRWSRGWSSRGTMVTVRRYVNILQTQVRYVAYVITPRLRDAARLLQAPVVTQTDVQRNAGRTQRTTRT